MLELTIKIILVLVISITMMVLLSMRKNKKINQKEFFDNANYQKFKETIVPIKKTKDEKEIVTGNLDQCKIQCDNRKDCVGFVRENKDDSQAGKCYLLTNVINCHNEYKEPSEKYTLSPGISSEIHFDNYEKYYDYNTFLKLDVTPLQKDNIQKCVRLNQMTGISPRKFPFSLLVLDENNNLQVISKDKNVQNKNEVDEDTFYSKLSVFNIVKGLNGKGVSFMVNKDNNNYYIVRRGEGENLSAELEETSLVFKNKASFILDMEYAEEETMDLSSVSYVSIKHVEKSIVKYWELNEVSNKVILTDKEKLDTEFENIMFQFKNPLPFIEEEVKKLILII